MKIKLAIYLLFGLIAYDPYLGDDFVELQLNQHEAINSDSADESYNEEDNNENISYYGGEWNNPED